MFWLIAEMAQSRSEFGIAALRCLSSLGFKEEKSPSYYDELFPFFDK